MIPLYHYTADPFLFDGERRYEQEKGAKPIGFWLSAEDDSVSWKDYCKGEDFRTETLRYQTSIKLLSNANVLHIATVLELEAFNRRFSYSRRSSNYIDWPAVASFYDGIIIAPYQWPKRLDNSCFWYYTWDCASGCIWDLAAIERYEETIYTPQEAVCESR